MSVSQAPEFLFQEMVALDRVNMAAHFSASGDRFDSDLRIRSMHLEWDADAEFFMYYREGKLAGYCECMPINGKLAIRSLQTNGQYSTYVTLRALLGAALFALDSSPYEAITSGAHPSNAISIKLHSGLGFQNAGRRDASQGGERILFEVSTKALCQRLGSLVRANPSVIWISRKRLPNPTQY